MRLRATVKQLDQMMRIHKLRVNHAERELQAQKIIVEEHLQSVEKLQMELAQLDADRDSVVRFLGSLASNTNPTQLSDANTRRRWLSYDREKTDYYLDIAQEDLAEAEAELGQKKNVWLKAQARESQTHEQRCAAARREQFEQESRESLEVQEQVVSRALARG